jgi:hypothetical protein
MVRCRCDAGLVCLHIAAILPRQFHVQYARPMRAHLQVDGILYDRCCTSPVSTRMQA